eukprot:760714-Hanusia_phi.AAC.3
MDMQGFQPRHKITPREKGLFAQVLTPVPYVPNIAARLLDHCTPTRTDQVKRRKGKPVDMKLRQSTME